ncbi:MAG: four helix bundle protein [Bacteroidetes bacterium]|nr:four helix bundle protein [Bacteroidota bacterium]
MTPEELQARCRRFAIEIILLVRKFPKTVDGYVLGRQLCKSGTAIGANYQSSRRAKSHADFVSKIKVSEEEADESVYWLDLVNETKLIESSKVSELLREAKELTAIFTAASKTAKSRQ